MKYLLDTNAMIHLFNNRQPFSANIMSHDIKEFAISGYTEAEIEYGIENSAPQNKQQNRIGRSMILAPFQRIYHDNSISVSYGVIKAFLVQKKIYSPSNEFDILIAATALAKNLILVTQNTRDFNKIPKLKFEDWSK